MSRNPSPGEASGRNPEGKPGPSSATSKIIRPPQNPEIDRKPAPALGRQPVLVGVGHQLRQNQPRVDAIVDPRLQRIDVDFPGHPPGFETVPRVLQPDQIQQVFPQVRRPAKARP